MKNIKKLLFVLVMFLTVSSVKAETIEIINNKDLKIYQVKEKEEVLVENTDILLFYKKNPKVIQEEIEEEIVVEEETIEPTNYNYNVPLDMELHNNIVNFAIQFNGNPYVMGGNSLTNGTDCSGFVQLVYANFGISLPRTTIEQAVSGYSISIDSIQPGDIVSYGYNGFATHSAIYIGNNTIIHASTPELGIRYDNMYIMPILSIRRIV